MIQHYLAAYKSAIYLSLLLALRPYRYFNNTLNYYEEDQAEIINKFAIKMNLFDVTPRMRAIYKRYYYHGTINDTLILFYLFIRLLILMKLLLENLGENIVAIKRVHKAFKVKFN